MCHSTALPGHGVSAPGRRRVAGSSYDLMGSRAFWPCTAGQAPSPVRAVADRLPHGATSLGAAACFFVTGAGVNAELKRDD